MGAAVDLLVKVKRGTETRPLALVAEDQRGLLQITTTSLKSRGLDVVPVTSRSQAMEVLDRGHVFDVALLDIHLEEVDSNQDFEHLDTAGFDIARKLRETQPDIEIIGYSGKFTQGRKLPPGEAGLFDHTFAKGGLSKLEHFKMWDLCQTLGNAQVQRRLETAARQLSELRRSYEAENPAHEILDDAARETGAFDDLDDTGQRYTAEGVLALADYEIRRLTLPLGPGLESAPLLVWQHNRESTGPDTSVDLEVYGYPDLYSAGPDEQHAVDSLAHFIGFVRSDLESMSVMSEQDEALRDLISYLYQA